MEIFESTVTTNILLVLYIAWNVFVKKFFDEYSSRKGNNRADKEDIQELEARKSAGRQPFDIELEKRKAQAEYIVEEFKESLKIRVEIKRNLYDGLGRIKVNARHYYHKVKSPQEAQEAFNNLHNSLTEVSDFMSCNKHFIDEIDPDFLFNFENKVNDYLNKFRALNEYIRCGNNGLEESIMSVRDQAATELLNYIDSYLEKIFKINPAELPYKSSI